MLRALLLLTSKTLQLCTNYFADPSLRGNACCGVAAGIGGSGACPCELALQLGRERAVLHAPGSMLL